MAIDLDDPEVLRKIRWQADAAAACLFVTSLHVVINNATIIARAMPWDCLDVAQTFHTAGASSITLFPGSGTGSWFWSKPAPKARPRGRCGVCGKDDVALYLDPFGGVSTCRKCK
jgi:hypothetical protein